MAHAVHHYGHTTHQSHVCSDDQRIRSKVATMLIAVFPLLEDIRLTYPSVFHVDRIQPIAEDKLVPFLDNPDDITPAQVLVAFYVLQFHDAIIAFKTDPKLATAVHVQYQGNN